MQTFALQYPTTAARAAKLPSTSCTFHHLNPPRMRVREKAEPSFVILMQSRRQPSTPPIEIGGASQPPRKFCESRERDSFAGAFLAQQGKGRYGENRRFSPVRMGSGVAKQAAGGKAFPLERNPSDRRVLCHEDPVLS